MSIVAALGLAVAGPFGYELLLNRRLRCRDDFERHFGIPVLAQFGPIPSTPG
jgi:protein tyrosine kinase modulator